MEFRIEGHVAITMEHKPGETKSKLVATDFYLSVSDNLDKKQYLDKEKLPTANGSHSLTAAFIQGLVGNIHLAHDKGFRDSAEHLRYIIAELERGFVQVATLTKGNFQP